jgi:MoaA/NifB/PqqE/SkfB family radical SAM enzyme
MFWDFPHSLIFEITNRCNYRCFMCKKIRQRPKKNMDRKMFLNTLLDPLCKKAYSICITGGEPFCIRSVGDYFDLVSKYASDKEVYINTNGHYGDKIESTIRTLHSRMTHLTVSFDGLSSHNEIRAYDRSDKVVLSNISNIKKEFPDMSLAVKFTITHVNYMEIYRNAQYFFDKGIPFHIKVVDNAYPKDIDEIANIISQCDMLLSEKMVSNWKYTKELRDNLARIKIGKPPMCRCNSSRKTLFVDPYGNVRMCHKKEPIGNLNLMTLSEIYNSENRKMTDKSMSNCRDNSCITYKGD